MQAMMEITERGLHEIILTQRNTDVHFTDYSKVNANSGKLM